MGLVNIFRKNKIKKCPFTKNRSRSRNLCRDISTGLLWWLHTNPSKNGLDHEINDPGPFQRDVYGVIVAITLLISPHQFVATCSCLAAEHFSSRWFFLNMSTNAILVFVTSSLLSSNVCIDKRKLWLVAGISLFCFGYFPLYYWHSRESPWLSLPVKLRSTSYS